MWLQGSLSRRAEEDSDWRQMVLKSTLSRTPSVEYPRKSLYKYSHLAFEAQTEVFQGHVELFK